MLAAQHWLQYSAVENAEEHEKKCVVVGMTVVGRMLARSSGASTAAVAPTQKLSAVARVGTASRRTRQRTNRKVRDKRCALQGEVEIAHRLTTNPRGAFLRVESPRT